MMGTSNFSDDFKRDAVAQITKRGYPVEEVSMRLGVSAHSLYAWKKKFSKSPDPREGDQAAEIRRLKQELARVTDERNIPKKGNRVLRQGCKVRCAFVAEHRFVFSVRAMCRCLRLHPIGFYALLKTPLSKRAREGIRQTELLSEVWQDSGKVYGCRKLHDDLLNQGETCRLNRVARLARLAGDLLQ